MSDLTANFEAAAALVKTFTKSPSNDEKLALYAYYKQATVGDNTTSAPGMFDLTGKAKWNAWNAKKGVSTEDAMKAYIGEVEKQKAVYA
ncbi:Acyl-CoA-binding domain-containing protein 1 [Phytophthora pseudosyringae]|uniref:Acyl-CoA-binding domain-containing protein 1 n=1 Tax=Phytophthora pseudosyringae TaxID=221518 RepID=A0A8T1WPR2_9STRA|nr:Acyl-CoA-binding domain-containing protein 1 [Phytophthora pseudosyringae]